MNPSIAKDGVLALRFQDTRQKQVQFADQSPHSCEELRKTLAAPASGPHALKERHTVDKLMFQCTQDMQRVPREVDLQTKWPILYWPQSVSREPNEIGLRFCYTYPCRHFPQIGGVTA
jgi:hypothetical protein